MSEKVQAQMEMIQSAIGEAKAYLTVQEAAKVLGVDRRTVENLIERRFNKLPAINISAGAERRRYRIAAAALAEFKINA